MNAKAVVLILLHIQSEALEGKYFSIPLSSLMGNENYSRAVLFCKSRKWIKQKGNEFSLTSKGSIKAIKYMEKYPQIFNAILKWCINQG